MVRLVWAHLGWACLLLVVAPQARAQSGDGDTFVLRGEHRTLGQVEEHLTLTRRGHRRVTVHLEVQGEDGRLRTARGEGRWRREVLRAELAFDQGLAGGFEDLEAEEVRYELQVRGDRCRARSLVGRRQVSHTQGRRRALPPWPSHNAPPPEAEAEPGVYGFREERDQRAPAAARGGGRFRPSGELLDVGRRDVRGYRSQADGEPLAELAQHFGVDPSLVAAINDRPLDHRLAPGEALVMPVAGAADYPLDPLFTERSRQEEREDGLWWRVDQVLYEYGLHPQAMERINGFVRDETQAALVEARLEARAWDGEARLLVFPMEGTLHPSLHSLAMISDLSGGPRRRYRARGLLTDPRSGQTYEVQDLFLPGAEVLDEVARRVSQRLRARDEDGSRLRTPRGADLRTVLVRSEGLEFVFASDQLGQASGWTAAYVGFAELEGLIDEQGPLGEVVAFSSP